MRVAFAGTPEFALPALEALAASPHRLVGVLTQPDRPSGRGRRIEASRVKRAAEAHGLPAAQPQTLQTEEARAALVAWRPDVLVVVAYGLVLPQAVLDVPPLGGLNIHPSLLPRWRGAAPIQRAILAGDAVTGVTIMQMEAGLDSGPLLAQRVVPIDRTTTSGDLHDLLAVLGAQALLDTLDAVASGAAQPRAQPAEGVTYAAKIEKSEALIDWRSSALQIERQVRAFHPRPMAETRLDGEPLRILAARALDDGGESDGGRAARPDRPARPAPPDRLDRPDRPDRPERTGTGEQAPVRSIAAGAAQDAQPGTVAAVGREAIVVSCGVGSLAITTLQRAGRRPVSAGDFANAGRLAPGQRLG